MPASSILHVSMKIIAIAGARSGVGKTTLAGRIRTVLPNAVHVKVGSHHPKVAKSTPLYPAKTPVDKIKQEHADAAYLILESNSILNTFDPECVIFLDADNPKPSAGPARERADIIRGHALTSEMIASLSRKLQLPRQTIQKIISMANATS
ncbi:MAG: hypothetical protein GF398_06455 [Chitinivibrionales bacterium]|nr:hypothetical protein [Chitinivibrionales bacterium]